MPSSDVFLLSFTHSLSPLCALPPPPFPFLIIPKSIPASLGHPPPPYPFVSRLPQSSLVTYSLPLPPVISLYPSLLSLSPYHSPASSPPTPGSPDSPSLFSIPFPHPPLGQVFPTAPPPPDTPLSSLSPSPDSSLEGVS